MERLHVHVCGQTSLLTGGIIQFKHITRYVDSQAARNCILLNTDGHNHGMQVQSIASLVCSHCATSCAVAHSWHGGVPCSACHTALQSLILMHRTWR
jgi:protein-arginine kinase activator protein McsA